MGWLSDIGNAVSSGASAVGDLVEDAVDAVVDTVEDVVDAVVDTAQDGIGWVNDWLCKNKPGGLILGELACGFGNIVGGFLDGFLQGVQDVLHDIFDIVRDLGCIVGSVFRLNPCGLSRCVADLLLDIVDFGKDFLLFLPGLIGGIIRKFKRSILMHFVETLVDAHFINDPQLRSTIRRNIGLEDRRFGFRLPAQHRVFVMDSKDVDLWRMHDDEVIDLYAMAGLLSFDSCSPFSANPNTVVKSVGSDGSDNLWPINRWTISKYLESKGDEKRLRVYAMSRRTIAQMLTTAFQRFDELGVILEWNDGVNFSWFRDYTTQPITETVDLTINGTVVTKNVYNFDTNFIENLLAHSDYNRPPGINCELVALAAFKLDILGRVAGRDIFECDDFPDNCETPGRTDRCCNTIDRNRSSGVIYRDAYPTDFFQYVLAHEIGHYLGLCHCSHGPESVMWKPPSKAPTHYFTWGTFGYLWEREPHFSLKDGKNAWRFIIDQMRSCLTGEPEPTGGVTIVPQVVSAPGSCAVIREPERERHPRVC